MRTYLYYLALIIISSVLVLGGAGCSDSDGNGDAGPDQDDGICRLRIDEINGQSVSGLTALTGAFDVDPETAGIQLEVKVAAGSAPANAVVSLSVTGLAPDPTSTVVDGVATFSDITVSSSLTSVLMRADTADCEAGTLLLDVVPPPECRFEVPADAVTLGNTDDKNPNNGTFDFDVVISTTNAQNADVTFKTNGAVVAVGRPGADGRVRFIDTVLPVASPLVLSADVAKDGLISTCQATIAVVSGLPRCDLSITPAPVQTIDGKMGLGIREDTSASTAGVQTNITVVSEIFVDEVTLRVNGSPLVTKQIAGVPAEFTDQTLPEGVVSLQATCIDLGSGNLGASQLIQLEVDSSVPPDVTDFSCTVTRARAGEVTCSWTSVGPGVKQYQLRRSTTPLSDANWESATVIREIPAFPKDQRHTELITGLPLGATYEIGLRAQDNVMNQSAVAKQSGLQVDFVRKTINGQTGASFTAASIASGDFNCDGFSDVAVGDPSHNQERGRVFLFFGNPSGLLNTPETLIDGSVVSGRFGERVAAMANFDGDGADCADLAVVASHANADPTDSKLFVYLGRSSFFDRSDLSVGTGAELVVTLPAASNSHLATSVASAGDFNGDGKTDLAFRLADPTMDRGDLIIHFGRTLPLMQGSVSPQMDLLAAVSDVRIESGALTERFAESVCSGKVDMDAFGDLLVSHATDGSAAAPGKMYVVSGAAVAAPPETIDLSSSSRVRTINGSMGTNANFGHRVAYVGDLNADGVSEFAVSDPTASNGAGVVYVFNVLNNPTAVGNEAMVVTNDVVGSDGDMLGRDLPCSPGRFDLNLDGRSDLVISAKFRGSGTTGVVYGFLGQLTLSDRVTSRAEHTFSAPLTGGDFGARVVWIKDVNMDGFSDAVAVDPSAPANLGSMTLLF